MDERNVPKIRNVVGSRFSLTVKHTEKTQEKAKPRLIFQDHNEKEKMNVLQDSNTLNQRSVRPIVYLEGMFRFDVWAHDMTEAYLHSKSLYDIMCTSGHLLTSICRREWSSYRSSHFKAYPKVAGIRALQTHEITSENSG